MVPAYIFGSLGERLIRDDVWREKFSPRIAPVIVTDRILDECSGVGDSAIEILVSRWLLQSNREEYSPRFEKGISGSEGKLFLFLVAAISG